MNSPFTTQHYVRRMEHAAMRAAEIGLSGILVSPGPDLTYFTGYQPTAVTERATLLLLDPEREPVMLVPALERPDAEPAPGVPAVSLLTWSDGDDPYVEIASLLDPLGHYAVSDSAWAMHVLSLQRSLPGVRYSSMTRVLPMLRAIKDADEVDRLAAAGAAADAAFEDILRVPFAGRTERRIGEDLAGLLRFHGHTQVDFTIVGSGPNGANPHHELGERVVRNGDMVILDFGGLCEDYGSDTTRTVHVGPPTDEECEVFEVVSCAQQAAFDAVRPGVECQTVDRAARQIIDEAGYGRYFIHRTGHGIGLTTHEPPYLVRGEAQPLEPGMCFSIEPGVYLPGRFGVRIEDIVTVTRDGGRRLNNTSHEMHLVA